MLPGGSEVAKHTHLHATPRELPAGRMKGAHRKEKIAGGHMEIGRHCSVLINFPAAMETGLGRAQEIFISGLNIPTL